MVLSFLSFPKRASRAINSKRSQSSGLPEELCRYFSLAEIQKATNNFDKDLFIGEGGFGNVYTGYIDDGAKAVAIRRMISESQEFMAEVLLLCQLRHPHLLSLIGFCHDEGEMILVYEYMSNGNLRKHLYDTNNHPLQWKKRLEICIGAARGVHYLHSGAKRAIVHRNVKTTTILLDDNWVAKVSGFGWSKMAPLSMSNALIRMDSELTGTRGYLDPEYAMSGQVTDKTDVFSFGVVLFEVLCARRLLDFNLEVEQQDLVKWARKCIRQGTLYHIIDPYLKGKIAPESFRKFMEIAESCVRNKGFERPTMGEVEASLEFVLELQENADTAIQGNNPGAECYYPEVIFPAATTTGDHLDDDVESDGSELSYPSTIAIDADAFRAPDTINSKRVTSEIKFMERFILVSTQK